MSLNNGEVTLWVDVNTETGEETHPGCRLTTRSRVIRDLDINERCCAAAPGIARICDRVIYTQLMLSHLAEEGPAVLDPAVLTEPVVVTETTLDSPVQAFVSDVGVPIPDDLTTAGRSTRPRSVEVFAPRPELAELTSG